MIKAFLDEDFLLENKVAQVLFHDVVKGLPIIDYHNHLPPDEIASDRQFENLSQVWLAGDHYKWRAMRTVGISEEYITGSASDEQKFLKWAETVPYTLRNPLFHWTHLELRRYFDIEEILSGSSAEGIYKGCNEKLREGSMGARGLLDKMNVEVVCTTDDPIDSLEHHISYAKGKKHIKMYPAFRPDKAIHIEKEGFGSYIQQLSRVVDKSIESFEDLLEALKNRMDFFHQNGCRISDHGLGRVYSMQVGRSDLNQIFQKKIEGKAITGEEAGKYKSGLLRELGIQYASRGWTMQLHLGALRNTNKRMMRLLGPDTGFDSIGDFPQIHSLVAFLSDLEEQEKLPKTIIYNLNPKDNEAMATIVGSFNDGSMKGKVQWGSAWWFLDQKDGMEKQLNALSNMGLLSCFVGMLTDSRSFLSFPRHEYFRRILCNLIGRDVHKGELPNDLQWLGKILKDICYHNAKTYFDFPEKHQGY
ncbi:MAG: glucuronate isomerase [Bacteroidia bacterium]|nr:glucuronate isomerase [Bacteroidia bacterium]